MRAVIDTCVLLDGLMARDGFVDDARDIMIKSGQGMFEGYVTAKSILDIHYMLHKLVHDESRVRQTIGDLRQIFDVLDTGSADCLMALDSPVSDYEDAVAAETARRAGADCIVTRNMRDYGRSEIEAVSPEDFLALLNSDRRG